MKLLSKTKARPLDAADIEALVATLTPDEARRARTAVGLIRERGFARGRSLGRLLDRALGGRPRQ
jgi:hypothetical protein